MRREFDHVWCVLLNDSIRTHLFGFFAMSYLPISGLLMKLTKCCKVLRWSMHHILVACYLSSITYKLQRTVRVEGSDHWINHWGWRSKEAIKASGKLHRGQRNYAEWRWFRRRIERWSSAMSVMAYPSHRHYYIHMVHLTARRQEWLLI